MHETYVYLDMLNEAATGDKMDDICKIYDPSVPSMDVLLYLQSEVLPHSDGCYRFAQL